MISYYVLTRLVFILLDDHLLCFSQSCDNHLYIWLFYTNVEDHTFNTIPDQISTIILIIANSVENRMVSHYVLARLVFRIRACSSY